MSDAQPAASAGTVCVVHGPKGGSGSSTLAVHLAVGLARRSTPGAVMLLDYSTNAAGARSLLRLQEKGDLSTFVERQPPYHQSECRALCAVHDSGLLVLPSATDGDETGGLPLPSAMAVIASARSLCTTVVIDTDAHYSDQTLAALCAATDIIIPTAADVGALRAVGRTLAVYRRLEVDAQRVRVVINRASAQDPLSVDEVARLIGHDVSGIIPDDRGAFARAMTSGEVVFDQSRSAARAPLEALVGTLSGDVADRPGRRLRRILGGR